ncbi:MAG: hypothetical protein GEU80_10775 [Dehalococcoidia bacterium]|nr:hypothetical protein [Dehalococcoidia bacterium]
MQSTVWLIELASGDVQSLHEDTQRAMWELRPQFTEDGEGVEIRIGDEIVDYDLDGTEVERRAYQAPDGRCRQIEEGDEPVAEIDGVEYPVNCGLFSPDGRRMLYQVDREEINLAPSYRVPTWDEWVLDLETGERLLLQDALVHCGGCDGRYGPAWSPSGRYVYFSDLGGPERVFVADVVSGSTRTIMSGNQAVQLSYGPDWSPSGDQLLRTDSEGGTVLEDLTAGAVIPLPDVPWPARFSTGGDFVYGPAYESGERPGETALVGLATQQVTVLAGVGPSEHVWIDLGAVYDSPAGPVALLEFGWGCAGTTIHHPLRADGAYCLEGARLARPSPDLGRVAAPRRTGATGRADGPGFQSSSVPVWEIVVVDVRDGTEQVLASGAISSWPPDVHWNEQGTHLLVFWPVQYGI